MQSRAAVVKMCFWHAVIVCRDRCKAGAGVASLVDWLMGAV